jgi:hypothetical protein
MSLLEPVIGTSVNFVVLALLAYFTGFAAAHPAIAVIGILVLSPTLCVVGASILFSILDFIGRRKIRSHE